MATGEARDELLARLAPRYVWWELEGPPAEQRLRTLAQIMDLGTYDDIRAVEAAFEPAELIEVMALAQPGWFSPRSWEFWRGRLALTAENSVPIKPPRRSFNAGVIPARP
jgi:hypothetical protein